MKGEQTKYTAKDFKPGMNIGLRHDIRAAIDLDCPEAIKVAGRFLPPTDTSGKESTPHSHWWYEPVNGEPPYKKFTDTDNTTTIIELRFGSNKQTVIPPSIHPNGEEVRRQERRRGLPLGCCPDGARGSDANNGTPDKPPPP